MRPVLLAGLLALALSATAAACDFMPDERPWEEQIIEEPVIFVGTVLSIQPRKDDYDLVTLQVDTPIRGDLGPTFETLNAADGHCFLSYSAGETMLFAGGYHWSSTFRLSDPFTDVQRQRLGFLRVTFFDAKGNRREP